MLRHDAAVQQGMGTVRIRTLQDQARVVADQPRVECLHAVEVQYRH